MIKPNFNLFKFRLLCFFCESNTLELKSYVGSRRDQHKLYMLNPKRGLKPQVILLCLAMASQALSANGRNAVDHTAMHRSSIFVVQNTIDVKGKVTDVEGEALAGVSMRIKGVSKEVVTDIDGRYTFRGVPDNATLVFSYIGMNTQKLSVNGKSALDVVLEEDSQSLDEAVVIGYGSAKATKVITGPTPIAPENLMVDPYPRGKKVGTNWETNAHIYNLNGLRYKSTPEVLNHPIYTKNIGDPSWR